MIRKSLIIDRADRLYQMPQGVRDFQPRPFTERTGDKTGLGAGSDSSALDLYSCRWDPSPETPLGKSTDAWLAARPDTLSALRVAFTDWAQAELSLRLDPDKSVFVGGTLADTTMTIAMAFFDPGDIVLHPNPGHPNFRRAIVSFDADPIGYPLTEKNDFKPRLKQFSPKIGRVAKAMFLDTPHFVSGASLDADEMEEVLWMARRDNVLIAHDCTLAPLSENGGLSALAQPSGKKVALEMYGLDFLTGVENLPVTCVIGSKDLISCLESAARVLPPRVSEHSAAYATTALRGFPSPALTAMRKRIRDAWVELPKLCEALDLAIVSPAPSANALLRIPRRSSAQAFANSLARKHSILTLPGVAFGDLGEGYLVVSLTGGPLLLHSASTGLGAARSQAG